MTVCGQVPTPVWASCPTCNMARRIRNPQGPALSIYMKQDKTLWSILSADLTLISWSQVIFPRVWGRSSASLLSLSVFHGLTRAESWARGVCVLCLHLTLLVSRKGMVHTIWELSFHGKLDTHNTDSLNNIFWLPGFLLWQFIPKTLGPQLGVLNSHRRQALSVLRALGFSCGELEGFCSDSL